MPLNIPLLQFAESRVLDQPLQWQAATWEDYVALLEQTLERPAIASNTDAALWFSEQLTNSSSGTV